MRLKTAFRIVFFSSLTPVPHLEIHLVAILVIGFVPHLHELVPDPIERYETARIVAKGQAARSKFTTFALSFSAVAALFLPDVGFRAKIHRGVVQDLQSLELGAIVFFRHPQPQLSEYALVGVVGRARRLVAGALQEIHRVLLRAGSTA